MAVTGGLSVSHNDEWFSAVNRFALLSPAATEAVPTHYNEIGLMLEGELVMSSRMGMNYALSIGNGVPSLEMMPVVRSTTADANGNRAFTGRLGLVLMGGLGAELGLSFAGGQMRDGSAPDLSGVDAFGADFSSFGPDLTVNIGAFGLRSYYYSSTETLDGGPVDDLVRTGMTVEPSYTIKREADRFHTISFIVRYSTAEEENLAGQTLSRDQSGIAVNVEITDGFVGRLGYLIQGESKDLTDLDNDVMSISLISEL